MYSIEEKYETAKIPGGHTIQLHRKKTVTSLKFKTVFAPEIQLYLHRSSNIPLNPMIMTYIPHSDRIRSYNLIALFMQIFFFFPIFIPNIRGIDLGPIYDCTTTTPLGIYDYPTIRSCKHHMNQEEYQVKNSSAEVFRYSPKVSKFPIILCSHFEITLTCDHRNIFLSSIRLRQEKELKVQIRECLAMVWEQIFNIQLTRENRPKKRV